MTTRMEIVTENVALAALRKLAAANPPIQQETLKEAFEARWPTPGSNMPMTDAIHATAQAVGACTGHDIDSSKTAVSQAWQPAVQETVEECFKAARHSFEKKDPLQGVETLTDAVRTTLGNIAALRKWPHDTDDNLYKLTAALACGSEWPATVEEHEQALDNASEEGMDLTAAMGASMGRPDMLKFGVYAENPDRPEQDGFLFATATIELANRLAGQEPEKA